MSVQVEKLEKNMAKLTIEVPAEEFTAAIESVYKKNKNRIQVPGFRKGKVPRRLIEQMYGKGFFYEDAANEVMPSAYEKAVEECGEEIVSDPSIEVTQIEEGLPFIFTAEVALKPPVTLGIYKGVEIPRIEVSVSDAEVEADLARQRENNSRLVSVDRPVEDGDVAVIDFEGFVDGVPFEGGKGEDYSLTIGSHSFIDDFEEQLIGRLAGDDLEVHVTFPENYQAKELAGKPAVFRVSVLEVKEKQLPDLDDEFASDVSEFETLEEYREDIRKNLAAQKEEQAKADKEDAAVAAVIAAAQMEIPEPMIQAQQQKIVDDFAQRLSMQGMSMETYTQYTGMTKDALVDSVKPQALKNIQSRLVLEAVAKAEGIVPTEEDYEAEIARMAESYQMEADRIKEILGENGRKQVMEDLQVSKAADFVRDNAVEVEKEEPETEETQGAQAQESAPAQEAAPQEAPVVSGEESDSEGGE